MLRFLIILMAVIGASSAIAEGRGPVRVGVITALSGGMATIGTAVKNGVELARNDHPALFQNIEFFYEDDQFDGKRAVSAYQKLRSSRDVDLIFGFGAILAHSVGPLAEKEKVPLVNFNFESSSAVGKKYLVRSMNHTREYMSVLASHLLQNGQAEFPIVATESSFLNAMISSFDKALGERGRLIEFSKYNPSDLNFKSSILKLRSKDQKFVGLFLLPEQLIAFMKQAKELGLDAKYFGTDLFETSASIVADKALFEGCLYPDNDVSSNFRKRYRETYGNEAQLTFAGNAYDMTVLVGELLKSEKKFDGNSFLQVLKGVSKRKGVLGEFSYQDRKDFGQYFSYPIRVKSIRSVRGIPVAKSAAQATDSPIRIGVSAPLTGPVARFGEWSLRGIRMAVDEINSAGGVNGRKIEIVLEDDKCSSKEAVSIVRKFQDVEGLNKLIVVCTAPSPAVAPLTRERSLVFSPSFRVSALDDPRNRHYLSLQPSMKAEVEALFQYVQEKGLKRLSIFTTLNDFWESYRQYLEEFATRYGVQIVSVEEFAMTDNDFRTALARVKGGKPDVIFAGLNPEPLANFLRQKMQLGVNLPTLGVWFAQSPDLLRLAKREAEGLVYSYHYQDGLTERNKLFSKSYLQKFGEQSEFASASSYDAVYLFKKLIEQCGEVDTDCLIHEAGLVRDFEGASGTVSFSDGSADKRVFLKTVKAGNFIETDF